MEVPMRYDTQLGHEVSTISVRISWFVGDRARPGDFLGLVLPGGIVFGRDTGGAVSNDLLGGHQVILVDQVADISPAEIVPTEVLQARLQPAFFQDLDQCIRCQASIFSRHDPFCPKAFTRPGDVAEQSASCAASKGSHSCR